MTMRSATAPNVSDFSQFAGLRAQAQRQDPKALQTAARQFEALMLQQMLGAARKASDGLGDDVLGGGQTGFYTEMFDRQLAQQMTQGQGMGLAQALIRQLGPAQAGADPTDESARTTGSVRPLDTAVAWRNPDAVIAPAQIPATQTSGELALALRDRITQNALPPATDGQSPLPVSSPEAARTPVSDALAFKLRVGWQQAMGIEVPQALQVTAARGADSGVDARTAPAQGHDVQTAAAARSAAHDRPGLPGHGQGRTPADFVRELLPHAQQAADELGIPARVLVAQAALETGWGRHMMRDGSGQPTFNFFGIKADKGWQGPQVGRMTREYEQQQYVRQRADFRAYGTPADAFRDYVDFLRGNPRYADALRHGGDAQRFVAGLQKAGYATDPNYAQKILRVAEGRTMRQALAQFDAAPATAVDATRHSRPAARSWTI